MDEANHHEDCGEREVSLSLRDYMHGGMWVNPRLTNHYHILESNSKSASSSLHRVS